MCLKSHSPGTQWLEFSHPFCVDLLSTEPVPLEPQSTPADAGTVARGTYAVFMGATLHNQTQNFFSKMCLFTYLQRLQKASFIVRAAPGWRLNELRFEIVGQGL